MNRFVRYWCQLMIKNNGDFVHKRKLSLANKVVITALMSALATMFQAAGNLIPGIGLFISPLRRYQFLAICYSIREGYFLISLLFSYYLLLSQVN